MRSIKHGVKMLWSRMSWVAVWLKRVHEVFTNLDRICTEHARSRVDLLDSTGVRSQNIDSCSTKSLKSIYTICKFTGYYLSLCGDQAQALIEYLLMLPLIFLLIINLVNFGGFFFVWITVANAARAGEDYAILGGASVGSLREATAAQISSLITQDISSLPNQSSLNVNICQNYNGTVTTFEGTCSAVPPDPEPSSYALSSSDVTYTYQPFIPAGFQFPNLGIYLTIPPTTVHRRALMRVIQ